MVDDFDDLPKQVEKAFVDCFGYDLHISQYVGNTFYTSLSFLIKTALKRDNYTGIPKEGWFIKFLKKESSPRHASKIQLIREFLKAYQSSPFQIINDEKVLIPSPITSTKSFFKGARVIDGNFKKKIESLNGIHSHSDFYLAKDENDCQWYGIIKNWDCKREKHREIKNKISNCFKLESKVAAVIWAPGGYGKSTLLRRLTIDLIDKEFRILWVTDLDCFCDNLLNMTDDAGKFLVIIEDWFSLKSETSLLSRFLNRVISKNNIRIIIGDRDIRERPYRKYVYEGNYFEISPSENERIIKKIVRRNSKWRNAAKKVLGLDGIFNAPLFIVLFILGRVTNSDKVTTKQAYSLFKEIVECDLKKIYDAYPALAKALYYTVSLLEEYNMSMTWADLLNLADCLQGNAITSSELSKFSESKKACKILSHYFSLKPFQYPNEQKNYIIVFHHDLIRECLIYKTDENWNFDEDIKLEILSKLIDNKQFDLASDLYFSMATDKKMHVHENQRSYFRLIFNGKFLSTKLKIIKSRLLDQIYLDAESADTETQWEDILIRIVMLFITDKTNAYPLVLLSLIKKGCKADCIKIAYGLSLTNEGCKTLLDTWMDIAIAENRGLPIDLMV